MVVRQIGLAWSTDARLEEWEWGDGLVGAGPNAAMEVTNFGLEKFRDHISN